MLGLPEDDLAAVRHFLHWFYQRAFHFGMGRTRSFMNLTGLELLKLYAIASKYSVDIL